MERGTEQYNEWLQTLKKGDEVAVKSRAGFGGGSHYSIETVKNITKQGSVRLDDDNLYKNGEYTRKSNWSYDTYTLMPIDDEVKEWFKRRNLLYKLDKLNLKALTTEQLESIYNIVHSEQDNG